MNIENIPLMEKYRPSKFDDIVLDPLNKNLSLGYLHLGEVELEKSFGTTDNFIIWDILSSHLDIVSIEVDGITNTYDYCWSDSNYKQMQIDIMKPGYDHSSRG